MAPSLEIRRATLAEIPIIQQLARQIWHAHYPGIISVEQIDYMLARGYATPALASFLDGPGRGIELALVDGEPAGFAAWMRISQAEAKLDKLYVVSSRQRMGIGVRLVRHVAGLALAGGARVLVLNVNKGNVQAIRAYAKHGFVIREAVVNDIGSGYVMDDYVMAMVLS